MAPSDQPIAARVRKLSANDSRPLRHAVSAAYYNIILANKPLLPFPLQIGEIAEPNAVLEG